MKLDVNSAVNETATADSLRQAIASHAHGAPFSIALISDDANRLSAEARPDGRFLLTCLDKGKFRDGKVPMSAVRLTNTMVSYLVGDERWRGAIAWRPNLRTDADELTLVAAAASELRRRLAGKREQTAPGQMSPLTFFAVVAIVILAFIGLAELNRFANPFSRLPWPLGMFWVQSFMLAGAAVAAMSWVIGDSNRRQARRAAQWPQTVGRILQSEMVVRRRRWSRIEVPTVRYQYSVDGKTFVGERVGVGNAAAGEGVAAMLARYPVGAEVAVYYDPARPSDSLLQRSAPSSMALGCLGTVAALYAIFAVLAAIVTRGPEVVLGLWPNAPYPTLAALAGAAGAGLSLLFLHLKRTLARAGNWPSTKGTIAVSRMKEALTATGPTGAKSGRIPEIEYTYEVAGKPYRNTQVRLRMVSYDAATLARYPKGATVEVHYNPKNPGDAALERNARSAYAVLPAALIAFVIALFGAGVF